MISPDLWLSLSYFLGVSEIGVMMHTSLSFRSRFVWDKWIEEYCNDNRLRSESPRKLLHLAHLSKNRHLYVYLLNTTDDFEYCTYLLENVSRYNHIHEPFVTLPHDQHSLETYYIIKKWVQVVVLLDKKEVSDRLVSALVPNERINEVISDLFIEYMSNEKLELATILAKRFRINYREVLNDVMVIRVIRQNTLFWHHHKRSFPVTCIYCKCIVGDGKIRRSHYKGVDPKEMLEVLGTNVRECPGCYCRVVVFDADWEGCGCL